MIDTSEHPYDSLGRTDLEVMSLSRILRGGRHFTQ